MILGRLRFAEKVRESADQVGDRLTQLGTRVRVLSGDSGPGALADSSFADAVESGLTPEGKMRRVQTSSVGGEAVLFVGDGINDAPALGAADVGVAFGDPADLPRLAADAVCLSDDLSTIPWLLQHSRRVVRIVGQNLVFAFGYNAIAIGFAAVGRLNPLIAALLMLVSSGLVVTNARRAARVDASGVYPSPESTVVPS